MFYKNKIALSIKTIFNVKQTRCIRAYRGKESRKDHEICQFDTTIRGVCRGHMRGIRISSLKSSKFLREEYIGALLHGCSANLFFIQTLTHAIKNKTVVRDRSKARKITRLSVKLFRIANFGFGTMSVELWNGNV